MKKFDIKLFYENYLFIVNGVRNKNLVRVASVLMSSSIALLKTNVAHCLWYYSIFNLKMEGAVDEGLL